MMLVTFLASFLIMMYVLAPLGATNGYSDKALPTHEVNAVLVDQKDRLLQMLKDLQLDHSLQNITEEEYQSAYDALSVELAEVLDRLEDPSKSLEGGS